MEYFIKGHKNFPFCFYIKDFLYLVMFTYLTSKKLVLVFGKNSSTGRENIAQVWEAQEPSIECGLCCAYSNLHLSPNLNLSVK